jgi:bacillithiol biosynthesis cysteine-adding enzyme BshC
MIKTSTYFSFRETKMFSETINQFQEKSSAFLPYISGFVSIDLIKKQIELKQKSKINRLVLTEALLSQYENIDDNKNANSQINKLLSDNTFTVTTGHQCCLFTGPLYFIYKIISTINLAKKLNVEIPENNFVPILWMATEDHDFAEINHINLLNKKIEFTSSEIGDGVGRISLDNIETKISEISELIQNFECGKTAIDLLKKAYQSNHNIATATRIFVHELFKNDGLIILDADSHVLKNEFKSVISSDILDNKNLSFVNSNTKKLIADGLIEKSQITPREVNFFLLDNNERLRIDKTENTFILKDSEKTFSIESLQELINNKPEKLSPNVVIRPMYQEAILPNLAYIGGGTEITYWLQLKEMFAENNVIFPILMLRNSVLILEKNIVEKFTNLGFNLNEIFVETQLLQKKYLKVHTTEVSFEDELLALQQIFLLINQKTILIDKTLESTVKAESVKSSELIKNIEQKILKAQKRNEETNLNQILKFKNKYFPNGGLQERNDNFLYYFSKYGIEFIKQLSDEIDPFNNGFLVTVID